jgi:heat shock protein HslJ
MSKTVKILIGALVAIVVIACVALLAVWLINRGGEEAPADPLAGTKWQVRSYYSGEAAGMASPLAGTQLTAKFTGGNMSGSAGCNTYNAGYTLDGDSLSVGDSASTMMFCGEPEGTMDQESAYLAALQSAGSFKLGTGQLQILNDQGQEVVDFAPYTAPPEATEVPPSADDS